MPRILLLAALCLLTPMLHAQERAAGNTMDTQVTWSALKNLVETANTNSTAAHDRLNLIDKCAKRKAVHAPGTSGADSDGCVTVTTSVDTTLYDKMLTCSKSQSFYDKDTNKCVKTTTADPTVDYTKCAYANDSTSGYTGENYNKAGEVWGTNIKTSYNALLYCPKNYVLVGVDSKNTSGAFCCKLAN